MLSSRLGCILEWLQVLVLDSIVVSIPACHAGDRGSIPRRGDYIFGCNKKKLLLKLEIVISIKCTTLT